MSCILIYNNVEDKKFHIASDSVCSSDDTKIIIKNRKFFKKEKFIFCVAGSMKFLNIIQYELDVSFKGKIDDKVIFTTLPYRVEELCKKYDLKDTCQMLFIVNNKVYCMQSDYSVIDYNDNYRVFGLGVGEEPAVGFFWDIVMGLGIVIKMKKIRLIIKK